VTDSPGAADDLRAALLEVLQPRAGVLEAYLFGSRARGDVREASDVDVAVYVDKTRTADQGFGLDAELADALTAACGVTADVVVLNRAPPLLYHRVLREGVRLLARDLRATTTREGRALSRYCDYVPQLAKIEQVWAVRSRSGDVGK
jgi:predicted nucleotidyltransferase